ncbi:MAG: carboxypeptidase-like regulatory domain-containing protein [Hydrotalea sp.]|jgi:hypothetical protein|nr:carboxypeptidase-like regulatory domain-containing protein [Hydrotalea sp.]
MIKKLLGFFIIFLTCSQMGVLAQSSRDSVVQLYGVVMTSDSLRAVPSASIVVKGKGRGTITNPDGVFSIVVLKGDLVEFSSIGYQAKSLVIPRNSNREMSVVVLLTNDTNYLPAVIVRPRPTREQFERDFVNNRYPDDDFEIARKNTDEAARRALMQALPSDGREAVSFQMRQQAARYYSAGQIPPMNIMNPLAWGEFIRSWKRGDYKKKR